MERHVRDIPHMYAEMMILMRMQGKEELSRNGRVLSLQEPLTVTVSHPTIRAVTDPIRMCNPFFHVMEFVWMMAGRQDPDFVCQFNSRFLEYADRTGIIHGAYGHRWRTHFHIDQITTAVDMLREDPTTRRAVLSMWDGAVDLGTVHNDLPCNTHIYLRIVKDKLEMTVCNRSNDVIWGMTGANAVHMTMLQELMATALGIEVGVYRVFTNNAHVYLGLKNVEAMLDTREPVYLEVHCADNVPLLEPDEPLENFLNDCAKFCSGRMDIKSGWLHTVAAPIRNIYISRKASPDRDYIRSCSRIEDTQWRGACIAWLQQKGS